MNKSITIWAATRENPQCDSTSRGDSDQPRHQISLMRVLAVIVKKACIQSYTTLTNFSTNYLMMCIIYTDVGGLKELYHVCPSVRKIIHSLKLLDYLYVQADKISFQDHPFIAWSNVLQKAPYFRPALGDQLPLRILFCLFLMAVLQSFYWLSVFLKIFYCHK